MSNTELETEIHRLQQLTSKLMAERRLRAAASRAGDRQAKAALDAAAKIAHSTGAGASAAVNDLPTSVPALKL